MVMDKAQTAKYLMSIRLSFPSWNKDLSETELNGLVNSWYAHFYDVPVEAMNGALYLYQKKSVYAPSIADIEKRLKTVSNLLESDLYENGRQLSESEREGKRALFRALQGHIQQGYDRDIALDSILEGGKGKWQALADGKKNLLNS